MTPSHDVALLLPWYAQGKLDADETRRVEEHLAGCADCRALLDVASDAGEGPARLGAGGLTEHVQAQLLAQFVEDPDALEADTERWVRSHLAVCEACEDAAAVYRQTLEETAEPAAATGTARVEAGPSWLASVWSGLAGSILRPAPALLYLLALAAVAVPLLRDGRAPGVSPTVTVVPPAVTVESDLRFRGEDGAEPLRIAAPAGGVVFLDLIPGLDAADLTGDASLDLRIRRGDRLLWQEVRPAVDLAAGALPVVLETGALEAGREHVIRIVYRREGSDLDGREVFRRTLIVESD